MATTDTNNVVNTAGVEADVDGDTLCKARIWGTSYRKHSKLTEYAAAAATTCHGKMKQQGKTLIPKS